MQRQRVAPAADVLPAAHRLADELHETRIHLHAAMGAADAARREAGEAEAELQACRVELRAT